MIIVLKPANRVQRPLLLSFLGRVSMRLLGTAPGTAAEGRLAPTDRGDANGRNRRNLAIAARSGEGPFTIRFADFRHRAVQAGGLLS